MTQSIPWKDLNSLQVSLSHILARTTHACIQQTFVFAFWTKVYCTRNVSLTYIFTCISSYHFE